MFVVKIYRSVWTTNAAQSTRLQRAPGPYRPKKSFVVKMFSSDAGDVTAIRVADVDKRYGLSGDTTGSRTTTFVVPPLRKRKSHRVPPCAIVSVRARPHPKISLPI